MADADLAAALRRAINRCGLRSDALASRCMGRPDDEKCSECQNALATLRVHHRDSGKTGLTWVTRTHTVDAVEAPAVQVLEDNPGWRLIGVGTGSGGQTTLTYGWPWPDDEPEEPDHG